MNQISQYLVSIDRPSYVNGSGLVVYAGMGLGVARSGKIDLARF